MSVPKACAKCDEAAARLGIAVVASATLLQGQVTGIAGRASERLPGLASDAQRAIQFTRSTPGISVALAGMGRREHVVENLGVARVPPLAPGTVRAVLPVMADIEIGGRSGGDGCGAQALPNSPAVFGLWPREGDPYLSKTALLRRRLLRLLKARETPSRLLNLRHTVRRIEYWLAGSAFESRSPLRAGAPLFPRAYLDLIKLRMPPYVEIVLANEFPRSRLPPARAAAMGNTSVLSARAPRPSGSRRSSSTCSNCAVARKT